MVFCHVGNEPEKQIEGSLEDILWHYTPQEGLLGIIENKNLRASNIFYLNDAAEFAYATGLIKYILFAYPQSDKFNCLYIEAENSQHLLRRQ